MAGKLTNVSFIMRATADLLPGFGVIGGKVRMDRARPLPYWPLTPASQLSGG